MNVATPIAIAAVPSPMTRIATVPATTPLSAALITASMPTTVVKPWTTERKVRPCTSAP